MSNILLMSTMLILVVIVLRAVFGKRMSMRLRYALWLPVALRLLLPFQLGHSRISAENVIRPTVQIRPAVISYEIAEEPIPVTLSEANETPLLRTVWYAGMAVSALWFATVNVRFYSRARKGAKRLEYSGLRVYVSDGITTPCQIGCSIFLTPEVVRDEQALNHVLAHEKTHFYHGDMVWSLLRAVFLCVYWFFPPVWIAAVLSKRDCELACDEGALRRLGEQERFAYGRTLVGVAAQASQVQQLFCTATTMAQSKKELAGRIKAIAAKKKYHIVASALLLMLVGFAVVSTFTGRAQAAKKPSESTAQTIFADSILATQETTDGRLPLPKQPERLSPEVLQVEVPTTEVQTEPMTMTPTEAMSQVATQAEMQTVQQTPTGTKYLGEYTIKVGEQLSMLVNLDHHMKASVSNGAVARAKLSLGNTPFYKPTTARLTVIGYKVGTVEIYFKNWYEEYLACIVHVVENGGREEIGFAEFEGETPSIELPTIRLP